MAFDPGTSAEHLETTLDLLNEILTLGTNPASYRDLIDYCQFTWEKAASPAAVDWAIDTCYTLAHHPMPETDRVMAFFPDGRREIARMEASPRHRRSFEPAFLWVTYLGLEVNSLLPEPESSAEEPADPWRLLNDKVIGIYTLTESAARQAQKALLKFSPGASVELNSELDCSASLKALARERRRLCSRETVGEARRYGLCACAPWRETCGGSRGQGRSVRSSGQFKKN